jgi:hypothetical protein
MMKNLLNILMLCCCIFLAACSNDDSPVDSGLQVIATSGIDFSAGGGEGTIVVSANGVISASSDQDWCSVTVEGSTVYVVAATSTEMTSRSALITISSESGFVEVPIVQSGLIIVMNEYNLYHSFTYEGGKLVYPFKTNTNYSIEYPEDAKSWLSYEVDEANNQILFTVSNNVSRTPRGAEIKLVVGEKETVLGISQIEVQREDIVGQWNCSYVSGYADGQVLSGPISIVDDSETGLITTDLLVAQQSNAVLPLLFENGVLYLKGNTIVGIYAQSYYMQTAVMGSDGYLWLLNSIAVPQYKDGNLIYHFGYSYNENMGNVGDLGFCIRALTSSGQSAGILETYDNFVISKAFN